MKKVLLYTFALICSTAVWAQRSGGVDYGFRLGLNYSNLSVDGDEDLDGRFGLHANFLAEISLSDSFSLQPEIGVSALGVNENAIALENGDRVDLKTNWLQVTVLANIDLSNKLYVLVGPQAGVNVTENDNNDYYNYDFLGVAGLGYMFDENWSIDLRYGFGLSNIFDRDFGEDNDASNRYFQAGISYRL
ncbi:porin family protein [Nonlabens xiamenensis]|uniref:porin family protein n=1 Tax=Nonlabens xiamenensis TaxID=2341043 RepID=UPI000F60FD15|nr:porin family protein [Nonlabens xiamenensis]